MIIHHNPNPQQEIEVQNLRAENEALKAKLADVEDALCELDEEGGEE